MTPTALRALQDAFYILSVRKTFTTEAAREAMFDRVLETVKAALDELPDTRADRVKPVHAENYVGVYNRGLGYAITSEEKAGQ